MSRIIRILEGIASSDRVAGAYVFLGPPGEEKKETANNFADLLECKRQDRVVVSPSGTSLKIDQIRDLQKWVRYGPSISRYLVAIVEGADTLTDQAAAAFLKTLEEPAPGVVFILLAEREDKLPDTILSRCQRVNFSDKNENWQSRQELAEFYKEIRQIKEKKIKELLQLSAKFEAEKERIEELLYHLALFVYQELSDITSVRIILDSLRYIKRRANLRLTLDLMCLKLSRKVEIK
jgi:DNA polymerase III delta prime subunit